MMVRILSVLPTVTGVLCALILLISLVGIPLPESEMEIPMIPCGGTGFEDCPVGMTQNDLDFPLAFGLLDLDLEITWEAVSDTWLGMVDASAADACPPDDNGMTDCQPDDFEYLAGGPESEGSFTAAVKPGAVRFVTGGNEGSLNMGTQKVHVGGQAGLHIVIELLLGLMAAVLLMSAFEMAFPFSARRKSD